MQSVKMTAYICTEIRMLFFLLCKLYMKDNRVLLITQTDLETEFLVDCFFKFQYFLPHGSINEYPECQPVLITHKLKNLNQANVLLYYKFYVKYDDSHIDHVILWNVSELPFKIPLFVFKDNKWHKEEQIYSKYS